MEKFSRFKTLSILSAALALVLGVGCGKGAGDEEGYAFAKLSFSNANAVAMDWKDSLKSWFMPGAYAADASGPSSMRVKMIAAYMSEDVDPIDQNNVGMVSLFYLNTQCDGDINHCNVTAGTAEDGLPYDKIVTDFFDFSLGTNAVNAALNAQNLPVRPGTYRYVRLEFCKHSAGPDDNVKWAGGFVGAETGYVSGQCGVTSVEMNPPLVVEEGDSVTVQLTYDYSESIQTGADAFGDDCVGAGVNRTCFSLPQFVPSVIR